MRNGVRKKSGIPFYVSSFVIYLINLTFYICVSTEIRRTADTSVSPTLNRLTSTPITSAFLTKLSSDLVKDFLFEWTNPETGETEKKVLSWHYVNKHVFPMFKWQDKVDSKGRVIINPKTGKPAREKVGYICHMISYQWISNYENLVKKGLAPAPKLPLE